MYTAIVSDMASQRTVTKSSSGDGTKTLGCSVSEPHVRSRPTLKDLTTDLGSLINWQHLMISMGVDKYKNDKIERNFPHDVDRQKQEAFDLWLRQTPDACWKNVIDALFDIEENTLARDLTKKYEWKDPRVSVKREFVCDPRTQIRVERVGDTSCRKFLPPIEPDQDFYVLGTVRHPQHRSEMELAWWVEGLISKTRPHNITDFLKSIEKSESKGDFKLGLEARFGKVYWKFPVDSHERIKPSYQKDLLKSGLYKNKHVFHPEIEERDLECLFKDRECIHELPRVNVLFSVKGQDEGSYMAVVSESTDDGTFSLDVVYREQAIGKKARVDISLPGMKYDFRIGDCSVCTISEHTKSQPTQIARLIVSSMHRSSSRNLSLKLCGYTTERKECIWRVDHIRQRIQKQYHWKPEKKWNPLQLITFQHDQVIAQAVPFSVPIKRGWLLVRYDLDVFDRETNDTVQDIGFSSPNLNKRISIPKFNYSRIEVELWGRKIFPENISDTHPSRPKCHHMASIGEVRFPRETPIEGSDWTTEDLMSDFNEFLEDAFKIACLLDNKD